MVYLSQNALLHYLSSNRLVVGAENQVDLIMLLLNYSQHFNLSLFTQSLFCQPGIFKMTVYSDDKQFFCLFGGENDALLNVEGVSQNVRILKNISISDLEWKYKSSFKFFMVIFS